ncbi:MAG TPA: hypothetical protein VMX12_07480 [Acidimicrobiia bacterium]|nr:hypothetical protein [Acidimicrobiia bacterium]
MSVQDNERRIDRIEEHAQRKDVCETIRRRIEGRVADVERHVDGLRQRTTGILVAVILALVGIIAQLALSFVRHPDT